MYNIFRNIYKYFYVIVWWEYMINEIKYMYVCIKKNNKCLCILINIKCIYNVYIL